MADRFIIEKDGAVYSETVKRERVAGDVAATFAAAELTKMQIVTPSLGSGPAFDRLRLAFPLKRADKQPVVVAARFPRVNFRTSWAETADGFLIPSFQREGTEIDPATLPGEAFKAALPAWAESWLVFKLPCEGVAFQTVAAYFPTLVRMREKGPGALWRWSMLPVPNQHGNGELCFGTLPSSLDWGNVLRLAGQVAECWFSAPWNTDLYNSDLYAAFKRMFRWKADTGAFAPGPREVWADGCRAFGTTGDPSIEAFLETRLAEKTAGKD